MKQKLLELFLFFAVLSVFAYPFVWAYSTISACGWKGLFVECRITENK
jgi:hypothetical protein